MCYLIAKERNAHGCIALKTTHGQHLADFKYALDDALDGSGIQFVTISRPTAYGEYAPYRFVHSEEKFAAQVLAMRA